MTPRTLPNGSTTDAVTNPAARARSARRAVAPSYEQPVERRLARRRRASRSSRRRPRCRAGRGEPAVDEAELVLVVADPELDVGRRAPSIPARSRARRPAARCTSPAAAARSSAKKLTVASPRSIGCSFSCESGDAPRILRSKCSSSEHFSGRLEAMRADRLVAALLLMQARGRVTAAELAEELEVSVATARRDLEALSAAGVPVYPQPGRGGGWSLVGGARTDLTGLTADRGPGAVPAGRPGAPRSPARPGPRCASWSGRCRRRSGPTPRPPPTPSWSTRPAGASATGTRPALVDVLQDAVVRTAQGAAGVRRPRSASDRSGSVDPWGLVDKDDIWYLIAGTDEGPAHVPGRPDRRGRRRPTNRPSGPPTSTLAAAWDGWSTRWSRRRSRHLGDRAGRRPLPADPAGPLRPALRRRRPSSRRRGPGPGGRADPARHRPQPGRLGRLVEVEGPPEVRARWPGSVPS